MNNEQQKQITDGGPAFPRQSDIAAVRGEFIGFNGSTGMSLRDYFAAHVDVPWDAVIETLSLKYPEREGRFTVNELSAFRAQLRYRESDAMLSARNSALGTAEGIAPTDNHK